MARNKGMKFWDNIIGMFDGEELDDNDFAFIDSMHDQMKTRSDKRIMGYFDIMIENAEEKEPYFKDDMATYANGVYKGYTDEEILQGMR